jgi:hypothetical protein
MDIQVAVLCDAATDYGGKLNFLGAFDTILATQMPAIHPQCSIALRMTFNKAEEGPHQVNLSFVDEDGQPVMRSIPISLEVRVPDETIFISRNFVVNLQQLEFKRPGLHSIDISLDGREAGSIPLLVRQMAPQEVRKHET